MIDAKPQARDIHGQYSFDGRLERVCVCGHTLGEHSGGTAPHDCLVSTFAPYTPCDCQKFRPSKRKSCQQER